MMMKKRLGLAQMVFLIGLQLTLTKFVLIKQMRLIRRSDASDHYKDMEVLVKLGGKINFMNVSRT